MEKIMVIQNSLKILNELSLLEEKIYKLEQYIQKEELNIDIEALLLIAINNRFNLSN